MERETKVELELKNFYNESGWSHNSSGHSTDATLWEDLRLAAKNYVSNCRLRICEHLPQQGDRILDAASGPIQYPEYLNFSKNFKKRVCVDISEKALEQAKLKLGEHGDYVCTSLLELPFSDNNFDASLSLHTIYHIDKEQQGRAVRELIRVTKIGQPLIIIYANPDRFFSRLKRVFKKPQEATEGIIYYYAHPLSWWTQFSDTCELKIFPWRALTASESKKLIPNNLIGKWLFTFVQQMENLFPDTITRFGAYPMIILTKKGAWDNEYSIGTKR